MTVKSRPHPHAKLAVWILSLDAFVDDITQKSEVAVDTEVEVGGEVEVQADSQVVHCTDGRSDRLAYVIYTTCRSCYLLDSVCMG